jgi:hypothetical protein
VTIDPKECVRSAVLEATGRSIGYPEDIRAEMITNVVLDALGMEQVGWADDSEPGAPVLMTMHFKPKVPSLWRPVYVVRHAD